MGAKRSIVYGYISILAVTLVAVASAFAVAGPLVLGAPPFVTFSLAIVAFVAVLRPVMLVFRLHPSPILQLRDDVVNNAGWMASAAVVLVALPLLFDATTRIKQSIELIQPFYADPALIRLDHFLFFGHDPWQITHALLGERGTRIIDYVYAGWLLVQIVFTILLIFARDHVFKIHVTLSLQLAWLLMGAGLAVAMASVGPCFVDDFYAWDRFAPLMERLQSYEGLLATNAMEYLLSVQGQLAVGGGISAMPSLHVGIAVLILLVVNDYFPRFRAVGVAYVATIYVGSIHLGWHYATDGLVSGIGMLAIWKMTGAWCRWLQTLDENRVNQADPARNGGR